VAETQAQVLLLPERERSPIAPEGAVQSAQEAIVRLPPETLEELWRPEYLERLARAYWRYLSWISLGLIRVVYTEDSRIVVLVSRHLPLLRFGAPEYETGGDAASVTWRIRRGLLVAREGRDRGFLRITVRKRDAPGELHVAVEVRNFYPWLRGRGRFARFGAWLYGQTQVRIHRLVTFGFLRSLARLDLPPSRIGALRAEIDMTEARG
jgi:hypothetical protein